MSAPPTRADHPRQRAAIALVGDGPVLAEANSAAARATWTLEPHGRETGRPRPTIAPWANVAAAAQVLQDAGAPMTCKAIMEVIREKKLWTTTGKTPEATIYAAIIREIAVKGKDARFKKVERGQFAFNGKAD